MIIAMIDLDNLSSHFSFLKSRKIIERIIYDDLFSTRNILIHICHVPPHSPPPPYRYHPVNYMKYIHLQRQPSRIYEIHTLTGTTL